jgi:phosphoribosylanthranilate isomerase
MTDTVLGIQGGATEPVAGFVGITGETCDWEIAAWLVGISPRPVIIAGGLSPENTFDAIARVRPAGVDSCTRTNALDAQGLPIRFRKDIKKVRFLVEEARRAEKALNRKLP